MVAGAISSLMGRHPGGQSHLLAVDARLLYLIPVMPLVVSLSAGGAMRLLGKLVPPSFYDKTQSLP
jgi:hypothetical protein